MGTIINAIAIVVATLLGIMFKKGLSDDIRRAILGVLGLALIVLSLGWFLSDFLVIEEGNISTRYELLIIVSLVVGTLIGEKIGIDKRLEDLAYAVEKKYKLPPLAKGFLAATLIFCVGAMAILGSLQEGLTGDMTILLLKSALDFVTALMLASLFGIGVIFSAISVLVYQGSLTLLATTLEPILTEPMIISMSMVGNVILVAIGINFLELKRLKVANMLPALLIPIVYFLVINLF